MCKNRLPVAFMLVVLGLLVSSIGCATAYHDYADCCIPYRYCVPAPLPHVFYESCHCPTPVGSRYAQAQDVVPVEPTATLTHSGEHK